MSSFNTTTVDKQSYRLAPQGSYNYSQQGRVTTLYTCPIASRIQTVTAPLSFGHGFTFDTTLNRTEFISNDVEIQFTIPLTFTLTTPLETVPTKENFIDIFFNNNYNLCYTQYSIIQALQNVTVGLNDKTYDIIEDVGEILNIITPYYNEDSIAENFPASQPDMFQSFDDYTSNSPRTFINQTGAVVSTSYPVENEQNIFASCYAKNYQPRTLV
jgi:hypothetical protein